MPTLIDAHRVALDIAAFERHRERPHGEWLSPRPPGPPGVEELVAGHEVLPHVQLFHDRVKVATGVQSVGTYPGHSPSLERALDLFVPVSSRTLGDAICAFAIANLKRYGVRYIIYRQHIWHRLDQRWVPMADRGDLTQNHFDHVHISFEEAAAGADPEPPTPRPIPDLKELPMEFTYIANGEDWVVSTSARFHGRLPFSDFLEGVKDTKVLHNLGERSAEFHAGVKALADQCGFSGDRS